MEEKYYGDPAVPSAPVATESRVIPVVDPTKPLACSALYDLSRPLEIEIGCGKGRFLTGRAARHPETEFLGIERMLERVRCFDRKAARGGLVNAHVLRLEAFYTFYYLLPPHHARTVYVFFPDPWPKRKHHDHRLFSPKFLDALWARLEIGGTLQFATDHAEYFETVKTCIAADPRFLPVPPMTRGPEEWTEFETIFRGQGMPIYAAAWRAASAPEKSLPPLTVPPELEPRADIVRRVAAVVPGAAGVLECPHD